MLFAAACVDPVSLPRYFLGFAGSHRILESDGGQRPLRTEMGKGDLGMEQKTAEEGMLELTILNAETKGKTFSETVADLLDKGLPPELVTRLQELWGFTKWLAGEIVNIGKIIIEKITGFVRANPNLAVGIAIGAAVGSLVGMVPFLGPILQPVAMVLGVVIGGATGARMDKGQHPGGLFEIAIALARTFLESLAIIFVAVKRYWQEA
ncbi:MAG: hypothetical protein KDA57_19545 [Planctomycetales bacterium]|nr:hypothetical protein [Planctomycetales bacterium]